MVDKFEKLLVAVVQFCRDITQLYIHGTIDEEKLNSYFELMKTDEGRDELKELLKKDAL